MKRQRILVIGGGLAGCWLGHELLQRGHCLTLATRSLPGESSVVAAGLFHPAPGKRWNLREGFAQEYPVAKKAYRALEALAGQELWQEQLLCRDLKHPANAHRWRQLQCPSTAQSFAKLASWIERIEPDGVYFHSSGRVQVSKALYVLRDYIHHHSHGQCWEALIEDEELGFESTHICVRDHHFNAVVLCRGWREAHGVGGQHLPWRNAAGEILRVQFAHCLSAWIHSAQFWQIPLTGVSGDGASSKSEALVGATHRWHEFSSNPQASSVAHLLQSLQDDGKQAELLSAQAGVRPIQQAREVLSQRSSKHPLLWVFNSLGSHGALRAPVYARILAEQISQASST